MEEFLQNVVKFFNSKKKKKDLIKTLRNKFAYLNASLISERTLHVELAEDNKEEEGEENEKEDGEKEGEEEAKDLVYLPIPINFKRTILGSIALLCELL